MIATYILTFLAQTTYVFLKAFQQLSVIHDKRKWITPVSILMGLCEVFIMGTIAVVAVAVGGFWPLLILGLSLGLGGGVGALLGMGLHKRLRTNGKTTKG